MFGKSIFLWLFLVVGSIVFSGSAGVSQAAETTVVVKKRHTVGLEMKWTWDGKTPAFGRAASSPSRVEVSRADFLVSGLALRREDGTWLESQDWYAYFKGAESRARAVIEGVPGQVYTAMRFQVGVDGAVDKSDPNSWPAGHALHPLVNGLHWGWQGGYIFMALEGHYQKNDGVDGGFSYHLAGAKQNMQVLLEGTLDLTAGGTVGLEFDLARVLGGVKPYVFGESTHSRDGDARAETLRARVEKSFRLTGVAPEIWQDPAVVGAVAPDAPKQAGTPWLMHISSRMPKVALPADNVPTQEGVDLGERLFNDTRLSMNGTQSCASCHDRKAAFTDPGRRFSLGAEGREGTRNAMPLFNLAWQQEFFWDGRVKRLRDQVLMPIQDPVEMHESLENAVRKLSGEKSYQDDFARVFGDEKITPERAGLVLEQFLFTLVSQDSVFDQALLGRRKLTPVEQRGLELFITEFDPARNLRGADCFHCHGGALFSSQGFANNGLDASPGAGRRAVTGLEADLGKFRVPSLRNIALTAPYMHDGRFATLEEVIDHYDHGVQRTATLDPNLAKHPEAGLGLTSSDKSALVAFLKTLTDPAFAGASAAAETASHPAAEAGVPPSFLSKPDSKRLHP
ncbi:MAG: hypothetical protein JWL81_1881 [Verrucomicrobiales bacterium]|nr:hypothetical protein [Verrucomicrobiales bacterium]